MTFNKKLLTSAVGAALTLGLGVPAAQADHVVLIPYVVKTANRTTVVTLIGDGSSARNDLGRNIHVQYWAKPLTAANTAACTDHSKEVSFTERDIVTFDTSGILGYPLFGDTTNEAPFGLAMADADSHGYLITRNSEDDGTWDSRAAYWLELDLANGGAHGDHGVSERSSANFSPETGDRVSDNIALQYGDSRAVGYWPTSIASTTFTVTPLGANMSGSDNNVVVVQAQYTDDDNGGSGGAYNRNEDFIDGSPKHTVRCVGTVTLQQLLPGQTANAAWAAQGGWGFLTNLNFSTDACGSGTGDCDAIIYQVDRSSAAGAGRFMANAVRITSDQN